MRRQPLASWLACGQAPPPPQEMHAACGQHVTNKPNVLYCALFYDGPVHPVTYVNKRAPYRARPFVCVKCAPCLGSAAYTLKLCVVASCVRASSAFVRVPSLRIPPDLPAGIAWNLWSLWCPSRTSYPTRYRMVVVWPVFQCCASRPQTGPACSIRAGPLPPCNPSCFPEILYACSSVCSRGQFACHKVTRSSAHTYKQEVYLSAGLEKDE